MTFLSQVWKQGIKVLAAGLVASALLMPSATVQAVTSQPRDCDSNSIMWCGAYTKSEWQTKVTQGDGHHSVSDIQNIYFNQNRGITMATFMSNDTVDGAVFKDGRVEVAGKTVATSAQSIGRTNMTGSHQSGTVWERPTSVSFKANSIAAFVYMKDGVFQYAVIKSCGNAVKATPVPKPVPPVTPPKPPVPPVPATFECVVLTPTQPYKSTKDKANIFRFTVTPKTTGNVTITGYRFTFSDTSPVVDTVANQPYYERTVAPGTLKVNGQVKTSAGISELSEACSATVTVTQETPTPTPTPTTTPESKGQVLSATLPATGPETVLGGIAGLTGIAMASRAYVRSRRGLRDALRGKRGQ